MSIQVWVGTVWVGTVWVGTVWVGTVWVGTDFSIEASYNRAIPKKGRFPKRNRIDGLLLDYPAAWFMY